MATAAASTARRLEEGRPDKERKTRIDRAWKKGFSIVRIILPRNVQLAQHDLFLDFDYPTLALIDYTHTIYKLQITSQYILWFLLCIQLLLQSSIAGAAVCQLKGLLTATWHRCQTELRQLAGYGGRGSTGGSANWYCGPSQQEYLPSFGQSSQSARPDPPDKAEDEASAIVTSRQKPVKTIWPRLICLLRPHYAGCQVCSLRTVINTFPDPSKVAEHIIRSLGVYHERCKGKIDHFSDWSKHLFCKEIASLEEQVNRWPHGLRPDQYTLKMLDGHTPHEKSFDHQHLVGEHGQRWINMWCWLAQFYDERGFPGWNIPIPHPYGLNNQDTLNFLSIHNEQEIVNRAMLMNIGARYIDMGAGPSDDAHPPIISFRDPVPSLASSTYEPSYAAHSTTLSHPRRGPPSAQYTYTRATSSSSMPLYNRTALASSGTHAQQPASALPTGGPWSGSLYSNNIMLPIVSPGPEEPDYLLPTENDTGLTGMGEHFDAQNQWHYQHASTVPQAYYESSVREEHDLLDNPDYPVSTLNDYDLDDYNGTV